MNFDPTGWKRSRKLLLGIATLWPTVYMLLFFVIVFSVFGFFAFRQQQSRSRKSEDIDLIELERKIQNGEISELTIRRDEIVSCDLACECEYHTNVSKRATQAEIIRQAKELDENGKPRVPKINEDTSPPRPAVWFAVGFAAVFGIHVISIFLMIALLVFYVVLTVKREDLDQTTRIVWVVMICMAGTVAMPVYWYLYIWRGHNRAVTTT